MQVTVIFTGCVLVAPNVRFGQSTYGVNEDEGSVQIELALNDQASTNITVIVSSTDMSAKGKENYIATSYVYMFT